MNFKEGRGVGGRNKIIKKCLNLDENDTLEKAYQKSQGWGKKQQ